MEPTMYDSFTLTLELGNDAMRSGPDVATALRDVADRIEHDLEASGKIRDLNGNTVGEYAAHNGQDPLAELLRDALCARGNVDADAFGLWFDRSGAIAFDEFVTATEADVLAEIGEER